MKRPHATPEISLYSDVHTHTEQTSSSSDACRNLLVLFLIAAVITANSKPFLTATTHLNEPNVQIDGFASGQMAHLMLGVGLNLSAFLVPIEMSDLLTFLL